MIMTFMKSVYFIKTNILLDNYFHTFAINYIDTVTTFYELTKTMNEILFQFFEFMKLLSTGEL